MSDDLDHMEQEFQAALKSELQVAVKTKLQIAVYQSELAVRCAEAEWDLVLGGLAMLVLFIAYGAAQAPEIIACCVGGLVFLGGYMGKQMSKLREVRRLQISARLPQARLTSRNS